jgi:16S rRNA (guanine966-N2)-methyltransferase
MTSRAFAVRPRSFKAAVAIVCWRGWRTRVRHKSFRKSCDSIETMRVIAGKFRSRTLVAPHGLDTRPTSDRLRETLFNVLAPRIEGAVFLDLYAGSGAVGIEAISRGAEQAVFVENSQAALEVLNENLSNLHIDRRHAAVELRKSAIFLKNKMNWRYKDFPGAFNIVFLDPPYDAAMEYEQVLAMLGGESSVLLMPEAIVVAEHRRKQKLEENYGKLHRYRLIEQGDAALSFYSISL